MQMKDKSLLFSYLSQSFSFDFFERIITLLRIFFLSFFLCQHFILESDFWSLFRSVWYLDFFVPTSLQEGFLGISGGHHLCGQS